MIKINQMLDDELWSSIAGRSRERGRFLYKNIIKGGEENGRRIQKAFGRT